MRKNRAYLLLLISCLCISSCQKAELDNKLEDVLFSNLDAIGKTFMEIVQTSQSWRGDWENIIEIGVPLPNSAVLAYSSEYGLHYMVPIIVPDKSTQVALFPIRIQRETESNQMIVNKPIIMDRDAMLTSYTVKEFLKSPLSQQWENSNITLPLNVDEIEPIVRKMSITRSSGEGLYPVTAYVVWQFVVYEEELIVRYVELMEDAYRLLYTVASIVGAQSNASISVVDNWGYMDYWACIRVSHPLSSKLESTAYLYYNRYFAELLRIPGIIYAIWSPAWDLSGAGGSPGSDSDPENPIVTKSRYIFDPSLTDVQIRLLIDSIEANVKQKILDSFRDKPIIIRVNSNLQIPGKYEPGRNTITIRSVDNIPAIREEFFHAFQDRVYPNGIGEFVNPKIPGYTNIEFEAKLYGDIERAFESGWLTYTMTVDNSDNEAYVRYVECLEEATNSWNDSLPINWNRINQDYDYLINKFANNYASDYPPNLIKPNEKKLDAIKELF